MLKRAHKVTGIAVFTLSIMILAVGCARSSSAIPEIGESTATSVSATVESASPLGQSSPVTINTPTVVDPMPSPIASPIHLPTSTTAAHSSTTPTVVPTLEPEVRFAVIGDYGEFNASQTALAEMIDSWSVDFIVSVGDNNYPYGEESTIDANIGQNFHEYIFNYPGIYGEGSDVQRFFPAMGNHDWLTDGAQPYLDYFTLPGNERYYTFTWGVVDFFILNSDYNEPDGVGSSSAQAQWLQSAMVEADGEWQLVFAHTAPYTSGGTQGPTEWMQWPYEEWGADGVLAGHEHVYERLQIGSIPYFVNGVGGQSRYNFGDPIAGSIVRYNDDYGALLVEASSLAITYQFYTISGQLVDTLTVNK